MSLPTTPKSPSEGACVVCCEPIKMFALGPCDHRHTCSECALRSRILCDDRHCCICKVSPRKHRLDVRSALSKEIVVWQQEQERVIFTANSTKPFAEFGLFGDMPPPGWVFDDDADAFFESKDHYAAMKQLRSFGCKLCTGKKHYQVGCATAVRLDPQSSSTCRLGHSMR